MIDEDVAELAEAKAVLAILSRLPVEAAVRDHEAAIIKSLARWAEAMDRGL